MSENKECFTAMVSRRKREHGARFNPAHLVEAFIPFYESQQRITVAFCDADGVEYERKRGRIGVTTGWRPAFLLMLRSSDRGSVWVIGPYDKVVVP